MRPVCNHAEPVSHPQLSSDEEGDFDDLVGIEEEDYLTLRQSASRGNLKRQSFLASQADSYDEPPTADTLMRVSQKLTLL